MYKNKRILISGASLAAGHGLAKGTQNPELFVNRLAVEILGYKFDNVDNISMLGVDNKHIFLDTALGICTGKYSDALVCWQLIPRINLNFGLEYYSTTAAIVSPENECNDINLVAGQKITGNKILDLRRFFLRHHNAHWEILELIKYINILKSISQLHNVRLHFVNYNMLWQSGVYFQEINWQVPTDLDNFTQDILQSDFRDDSEVRQLYQMIHTQYQTAGGINSELWLNLHAPLRAIQLDISDEGHPGILSQQVFFDYLSVLLKK